MSLVGFCFIKLKANLKLRAVTAFEIFQLNTVNSLDCSGSIPSLIEL